MFAKISAFQLRYSSLSGQFSFVVTFYVELVIDIQMLAVSLGPFTLIGFFGYVSQALQILKSIPDETKRKLVGKGYFPQNGFILQCLPVPPNCLSVPDISDGTTIMSSVSLLLACP